jgi:hypothetical protein
VQATLGTGKVTLTWPDAGLGVHYRVYLQEPGGSLVRTVYANDATITGLPPGKYQARVVPVNFKKKTGPAAKVTFTVP